MSMLPIFESIARVAVAILVNSLWQGVLIAFVAWVALRFFGKANASTRYVVWSLALCAVVIVPVATSLSRVSVEPAGSAHSTWTPAAHSRVAQTSVAPATNAGASHSAVIAPSQPVHEQPAAADATPLVRMPHVAVPSLAAAVAFALWLLAAIVVLVRLGVALVALERLKRDALPLAVDYRDSMPRWDAALKGHRDVRLCVSDDIEVPVAVGLFDAMILLPSHLVHSLDPTEIDQISLHELAHLLRSDDWTNGLQRLASALLFFNPAVWFIARQMDIEREVACDDFVLELTGAVRPYAFCLTKMAEMTAWPHRAVAAPGVFVTRKNISIRIERLLRTGRSIGSSIAPGVAASVSIALLAIFFVLRTMTPSIAFSQTSVADDAHAAAAQAAVAEASPAAASSATSWTHEHAHAAAHAAATAAAHAAAETHVAAHAAAETHVAAHAAAEAQAHNVKTVTVIPPIGHMVAQALVQQHVAQLMHDSMKTSIAAVTHSAHGGDCLGCDYANADLQNKDFSNRAMEGSDFAHANLQGSRFDRASLTGVNFKDADLRNVSFVNADLEGCNMRGARLEGARFDGAQLTGCNIDASTLSPDQARIVLTQCEGCNFERVNLRGMDLHGLRLEGANLAYADLRDTNLSGAMFTGVNFRGARLDGARVDNADFTGCEFRGTDLRNVDLSKASFTGSAMSGAIMR